ncbi:unnamed protein product [Hymenolepis diminuta]|uniref:Uncharacterized protein n=1 Tax=Hymenolepis diminuta TaxID=6216 RepID=A0A564YBW8_HYMDI|nr:unnamed protein product [Hymenolepis diminuta]
MNATYFKYSQNRYVVENLVVSIDRVTPAYLDKPVIENSASVFHSKPPDKETGNPIVVSRSGRHVRFPDRYKV